MLRSILFQGGGGVVATRNTPSETAPTYTLALHQRVAIYVSGGTFLTFSKALWFTGLIGLVSPPYNPLRALKGTQTLMLMILWPPTMPCLCLCHVVQQGSFCCSYGGVHPNW